jgi:hypothetical protein
MRDREEIIFPHAVHGGAVELRLPTNDVEAVRVHFLGGEGWKALDVYANWFAKLVRREL